MSVRKLTLGLLAIFAFNCGLQSASAQHEEHMPFVDPMAFEPDFRWFEPVYNMDLADMRPSKRASTGWFGALDRMNLFVTRPENEASDFKLDDGWGGRVDVGFMNDKESGWLASFSYLDGPNADRTTRTPRINILNEDDLLGAEPDLLGPRGQLLPEFARNSPGLSQRYAFPGQSLNIVEIDSFELNKTFRMEPYHYGGILEPMIGFRYMQIEDTFFRSQYRSTEAITLPLLISPTDDPTEQIITDLSRANNQMFGGQIGFRYFKYFERFKFSTDLRVFAMHNYQSNTDSSTIQTTVYGGTGIGTEAEFFESNEVFVEYAEDDEFAFGFDLRTELAYTLTRDFSIRGGLQLTDVAQGVWRGRISDPNDQTLVAVGYTFGITLNR